MSDDDIKIADIESIKSLSKRNKQKNCSAHEEYDRETAKGNTLKAKALGYELADDIIKNLDRFTAGSEEIENSEISAQRGVLMVFAATVVIENKIDSSVVSRIAENSFNERLESAAPWLYKAVGDSGAFSFYYLAYRRGTEVERRIGQTFAMLCSHDGDPVYQELGEAIYCWFISHAEKKLGAADII